MVARSKRRWCAWILGAALVIVALRMLYAAIRPTDEVVLTIGESYEQVRERSRSTLPPVEPGGDWGGLVTRPAKLRFTDPQYGSTTPPAKFLSVAYDGRGNVRAVRMSPQVKTLPLDEAMAVLMDLQRQLRSGGWRPFHVEANAPLVDTPEVRAVVRTGDSPTTYWAAGDKYQAILFMARFVHENRPKDERYLITLNFGPPWLLDDTADIAGERRDRPVTSDEPAGER